MYLMLEDQEVLYFDFDDNLVEPIKKDLLPFSLRSAIRQSTNSKDLVKTAVNNVIALKEFFSNRVLSLSRDNAKLIYTMFQIPQSNDLETRVKICLKCRGVNLQDGYWIKNDNEKVRWSDVDIRENSLAEILDVSLNGVHPTYTTDARCPELVTKGLFRKAWTRQNGKLILLKSDRHCENVNTKMEVLASKLLDCFSNLPHVSYIGNCVQTADRLEYVDQCELFGRKGHSFVEAREVKLWCEKNDLNFKEWSLACFGSKIANIAIADFIIMNTDRHLENYGFWMNNQTGKLVDVAPIFDYNLALVADAFNKDASDTLSQMFNENESIQALAMELLPHSNLDVNYHKLNSLIDSFRGYGEILKNVEQRLQICGYNCGDTHNYLNEFK